MLYIIIVRRYRPYRTFPCAGTYHTTKLLIFEKKNFTVTLFNTIQNDKIQDFWIKCFINCKIYLHILSYILKYDFSLFWGRLFIFKNIWSNFFHKKSPLKRHLSRRFTLILIARFFFGFLCKKNVKKFLSSIFSVKIVVLYITTCRALSGDNNGIQNIVKKNKLMDKLAVLTS